MTTAVTTADPGMLHGRLACREACASHNHEGSKSNTAAPTFAQRIM